MYLVKSIGNAAFVVLDHIVLAIPSEFHSNGSHHVSFVKYN